MGRKGLFAVSVCGFGGPCVCARLWTSEGASERKGPDDFYRFGGSKQCKRALFALALASRMQKWATRGNRRAICAHIRSKLQSIRRRIILNSSSFGLRLPKCHRKLLLQLQLSAAIGQHIRLCVRDIFLWLFFSCFGVGVHVQRAAVSDRSCASVCAFVRDCFLFFFLFSQSISISLIFYCAFIHIKLLAFVCRNASVAFD